MISVTTTQKTVLCCCFCRSGDSGYNGTENCWVFGWFFFLSEATISVTTTQRTALWVFFCRSGDSGYNGTEKNSFFFLPKPRYLLQRHRELLSVFCQSDSCYNDTENCSLSFAEVTISITTTQKTVLCFLPKWQYLLQRHRELTALCLLPERRQQIQRHRQLNCLC